MSSEPSSGLFGDVFRGILPSTVKPTLEQNTLTIRITEAEFTEMATKGIDARVRNSMNIRIKEGYIEVTVRVL